MSAKRNYYDVLQVNPRASQDEIKKSFHKLSKEFHPDKHVKDPDSAKWHNEFCTLQEAYDCLSDVEKRKNYDSMQHQQQAHQHPQWQNTGSEQPPCEYSPQDIRLLQNTFSKIFSTILSRRDQEFKRIPITCTLHNVYHGCIKTHLFNTLILCPDCGLSSFKQCPACNGTGVITQISYIQMGNFTMNQYNTSDCHKCATAKFIPTAYPMTKLANCKRCNNQRYIQYEHAFEFDIQPGAVSGSIIEFKRKQDQSILSTLQSFGMPNLQFFVQVEKHSDFEFDEKTGNLKMKHEISMIHAILGYNIPVKHPSGEQFTISCCDDEEEYPISGTVKILNNGGMRRPKQALASASASQNGQSGKAEFGHLEVEIIVKYPKKVPKGWKSALRQFDK
jgi:DnaJ-class molecular chaperone